MIISELTETNTVDGYVPVDVSGDTKKISGSLLTASIANNLTTNVSGYVLDATQGKALNDQIQANAASIAAIDTGITAGTYIKSQPWALYAERSTNSDSLSYPSDANEIMIVAWDNDVDEYYMSTYIPGMTTDTVRLLLAGYCQDPLNASYQIFGYIHTSINPTDHTVAALAGRVRYQTTTGNSITLSTSSNWSTQIWYR